MLDSLFSCRLYLINSVCVQFLCVFAHMVVCVILSVTHRPPKGFGSFKYVSLRHTYCEYGHQGFLDRTEPCGRN
jgi:hypothetical protein